MGKAGLAFVLLIVLVASAIYVTGLGDDLMRITGNAIKEKVLDKLQSVENTAEKNLGNTIGGDKIKINLTNPLTGDAIEYSCEKGIK
ncbi:MAG: hypothetical protein HY438_00335 [DPANN group archaeon]|nr:hypothetical protein [DPANN group archaeon]